MRKVFKSTLLGTMLTATACGNQVSVPESLVNPPEREDTQTGDLIIGVQPAFPLTINDKTYENIEQFGTELIVKLPEILTRVGIDPLVAKRAKLVTDLSIDESFVGAHVAVLADEIPMSGVLGEDRTASFDTRAADYSVRIILRLEIDAGAQPVCANLVGFSENKQTVTRFETQITAVSCQKRERLLGDIQPASLYKGMSISQVLDAVPTDYLKETTQKGSTPTFCFSYQSVLDSRRMCSDYSSGPYTGVAGLPTGCYCTLEFDRDGKLANVRSVSIRYLDVSLVQPN